MCDQVKSEQSKIEKMVFVTDMSTACHSGQSDFKKECDTSVEHADIAKLLSSPDHMFLNNEPKPQVFVDDSSSAWTFAEHEVEPVVVENTPSAVYLYSDTSITSQRNMKKSIAINHQRVQPYRRMVNGIMMMSPQVSPVVRSPRKQSTCTRKSKQHRFLAVHPNYVDQLMCKFCCKLVSPQIGNSVERHIAAHLIEFQRLQVCGQIKCPFCDEPIRSTRRTWSLSWPSDVGYSPLVTHLETVHRGNLATTGMTLLKRCVVDDDDDINISTFFIHHQQLQTSSKLDTIPFASMIACRCCSVSLYTQPTAMTQPYLAEHIASRIRVSQRMQQPLSTNRLILSELRTAVHCPACRSLHATSADVLLHILVAHRSTPNLFTDIDASVQQQFDALLSHIFGHWKVAAIRRIIFSNHAAITGEHSTISAAAPVMAPVPMRSIRMRSTKLSTNVSNTNRFEQQQRHQQLRCYVCNVHVVQVDTTIIEHLFAHIQNDGNFAALKYAEQISASCDICNCILPNPRVLLFHTINVHRSTPNLVLSKQSRALSRTMDAYFDTLLTQLFGNTAINAVKCILFASYLEECGDSAMTIFETISRQNQDSTEVFSVLNKCKLPGWIERAPDFFCTFSPIKVINFKILLICQGLVLKCISVAKSKPSILRAATGTSRRE